jgi:hypothetical protein
MSDPGPLEQQYIRAVSNYVAARRHWGAVSKVEDEIALAKEAKRALSDSPEEDIQALAGAYLDALDTLVDSTSEMLEHARAVRGY